MKSEMASFSFNLALFSVRMLVAPAKQLTHD